MGRSLVTNRIAPLALLAVLVTACSDAPPRPSGPATVEARLTSPNGAEGAALIELIGDFGEIAAAGNTTVMSEPVNDSTARILLISAAGGQLSFQVFLEEQRRPPRVRVLEVADTLNQLRPAVTGYGVAF